MGLFPQTNSANRSIVCSYFNCVSFFQAIAWRIVETKAYGNARDIWNMYERTGRNQFM